MRTVARGKPFKAKGLDWAGIERDYRAGVQSNRAIARSYGCSEGAIRLAAAENGWIKGEATAVRTRARQKADEVSIPRLSEVPAEKIEQLAEVGAQIINSHRSATGTMAGLAKRMVEQLTDQTEHEADLAEQIKDFFEAKAAQNPLAAAAYRQQCNHALHAITLGSRSKTLLNLTTAVDKLQQMERRAWGLEEGADNRSYEDLLAEIEAKRAA